MSDRTARTTPHDRRASNGRPGQRESGADEPSGPRERTGPDAPQVPHGEVGALLGVLDGQRRHVLGILDGLDEEALRRPVLPSGWHCLGMVRHLALDVERFWFRACLTGDQEIIRGFDDAGDAWQVDPALPAAEVFDLYRRETALANSIAAALPADAPLGWWPRDLFGEPHLHDLRDILLHVITETACHAGHLDAARELIDGRRWLTLT